jgi:hypothetical protein
MVGKKLNMIGQQDSQLLNHKTFLWQSSLSKKATEICIVPWDRHRNMAGWFKLVNSFDPNPPCSHDKKNNAIG